MCSNKCDINPTQTKWNVANLHLTIIWSSFNCFFFKSLSQTPDKQERVVFFFLFFPTLCFLSAPVNYKREQWDLTRPLKMVLNCHFWDMTNYVTVSKHHKLTWDRYIFHSINNQEEVAFSETTQRPLPRGKFHIPRIFFHFLSSLNLAKQSYTGG